MLVPVRIWKWHADCSALKMQSTQRNYLCAGRGRDRSNDDSSGVQRDCNIPTASCVAMPAAVYRHRAAVFMYTRLHACMSKLRCCVFVTHGRCAGRGRERSKDDASADVVSRGGLRSCRIAINRRFDNQKNENGNSSKSKLNQVGTGFRRMS